jgi:hypothetical protein
MCRSRSTAAHSRLPSAEPELTGKFFFFFVGSVRDVFNEDLGVAPSVRQDSVRRDRLAAEVCQDQSVKISLSRSVWPACLDGEAAWRSQLMVEPRKIDA